MADDGTGTEIVQPGSETPPPTQPASETPAGGAKTVSELQAELEKTAAALKQANAEAAKRRKQIESIEAERQAQADAELSEMERLQKQLAEREGELTRMKMNELKRKVAADVGLPAELALRLTGTDEDELKADAEGLLKVIPKKTAPNLQPTNPGNNAQPGTETIEQRRARVRRDGTNIFDPGRAAQRGGGVHVIDSSG